MLIPDFQTIMSPLFAYTSDNNEYSLIDTADNLAVFFNLTNDERQELLPSGHTAVFVLVSLYFIYKMLEM